MTCLTDDGVRIAYDVAGPNGAPALVLLHSLGGSRDVWTRTRRALHEHARTVAIDLRGHGASEAAAGDYSLERLAGDVEAVMDAEGVSRADVAGVSIGGMIALWMARYRPARVARACVVNSAARIQDESFWQDRMALVAAQGLAPLADASVSRWFTAEFARAEPAVVQGFRDRLVATAPAGYLGCCAALRDADLRAACAEVTRPVLVITGRHDASTPPVLGEWIAAQVPGARLVEVPAAHLSPVEAPAEVARALQQFLRG